MKKILALALFAVVVLTLASCGGSSDGKNFDKMTAFEHYAATNEKMKSAESLQMDMNGKIGIIVPLLGMNMDMDMRGVIQQVIRSETDQDLYMDAVIGLMGQSVNTKIHYVDGVMYQDDGTNKTKRSVSLDEINENIALVNGASSMEFSEVDILESSMEDTDGGKRIVFVIDPIKVNSIVEQMTGPALSSVTGAGEVDLTVDLSGIEYEMTFDREHNIKSMRTVVDMSMVATESGMEIAMDISMDMTYDVTGINTISKIEPPEDADSYEVA